MEKLAKIIGNVEEKPLQEMINLSKENEIDIIECKFINENKIDFYEENLEFKRCIFYNCKLEGRLDKAYFTYVIFENCDLSNCYFNESNFNGIIFKNCKLVGTNFIESRLNSIEIENSIFNYASFNMSSMREVNIIKSEFNNSAFQEVNFNKVILKESSFIKTQFLRTKLMGIDFTTCEINGLATRIEDLKGAIVTIYQAAELAKLLEVVIKWEKVT